LRVLLICDFHLKYATQLAGGLVDEGCNVTLLSRSHDFEFGGRPGARRAFVESHLRGRAAHFELPGRVRDPRALTRLWPLSRALRARRPEVVHAQEGVDVRPLIASGRLLGGYALTIHDPLMHHGAWRPGWHERVARRMFVKRAGLLFVHGEALKAELIRRERPRAPVAVVPHGVSDPSVAPLPRSPNLLFFGRILAYKGLDTLLDAMPRVWEADPSVRLTVAGEGRAPDHPLLGDERVRVINGYVPDAELAPLFAACTCVVLPYREASQSGVGTLAQRFGRAVVATAVGGLPELVHEDAGSLVPPDDPVALAAAIVTVVGDPATATAMGEAAAARVQQTTGWRAVARTTLAAYEQHLLP
jgi:starch synthase